MEAIRSWLGAGAINIFGRPFAGKDTQGRTVAESLDGALIGGGDILRNSTIPAHVDAVIRRGELAPRDEYINIVLPYVSREEFAGKPLILSSVGRWTGEEQPLMQALKTSLHPLKAVIYLELSEETVRQRWQALATHDDRNKRYDDTADILEKRLVEFREKTLPVLAAYRELGLLHTVNADQPVSNVTDDIMAILQNLAQTTH